MSRARQTGPRGIVLLMLAALLWMDGAALAEVRFALVVGNNRGADREKSLRWAERDAERVASLLGELGGFDPGRVVLVQGSSISAVTSALDRIDERIRKKVPAEQPRALLVFYFSGHADGLALELGRERWKFDDLRQRLDESPAQVKLAFIDACHSGGLIAKKGGAVGPAFDLVLTDSMQADGTAVITSSGAGENSQESAQLQGSFFTAALLSGLRGAADANRDQRVTLAEVYQFAYDRTVHQTSSTLGGTQHPVYEYQLSGKGRVVLADLDRAHALLSLGPDIAGSVLVVRRETGEVVAELTKPYGQARDLALPAGGYQVGLRRGIRLLAKDLDLADGARVRLDPQTLEPVETLVASAKAGGIGRGPFGLFVQYGLNSGALNHVAPLHQVMAGLRVDIGPISLMPRFGYGMTRVVEPPLEYSLRIFALDLIAAWRFELTWLDLFVGLRAGTGWGKQRFPDGKGFSGSLFAYGAVAGLDVPIYRGLALQLFWELGANAFRVDEAWTQQLSLEGVLGLGFQF